MEEIILKELIKNRSLDTCNDFVIWADKCDLEPLAKKIAEAINYTPCCKSDSEQLVCEVTKLDCPFDFTSRCTIGRCDCKPKTN